MDTFSVISANPLCTPFQKAAWTFSEQLEKEGYFNRRKANFVRQSLSVAYNPNTGLYDDLLSEDQDNPSSEVLAANIRTQIQNFHCLAKMKKNTIDTFTDKLPQAILNDPGMQPLLEIFPQIDLGPAKVVVCGDEGDGSCYFKDGFTSIITVSPDLFGLPTLLLAMNSKVYPLGMPPYNIGMDLIYGCYELIAQEGHQSLIGVAGFINELVDTHRYNVRQLAKEFILGDPKPLFSVLESVNPLAPALLTFISSEANETKSTIDRLLVMKKLNLLG